MKFFRQTVLIGLVTLAASLGMAADDAAVKKDMAALQGEWEMVSGTVDGFSIPPTMTTGSKRVCKGDEVSVVVGGNEVMKAKVVVDPSKKPKTIDYQITEGANKGKTALGIYEVEDGYFKSCFAAPGADRPTEFKSKSGTLQTLTTWKKKPAETAPPVEKK